MELIRCHIDNFGVLSDKVFHFSKGLTALCLENGQGKSTLCAFLKCMLYGLSESRSRDLCENERKHYAPWQGGTFGGSLILRHEGKLYRVTRRFGTKPSEDLLEVFDEQTGEPSRALGDCPGETLFFMDARGFASCALFSERAFAPTLTNESILSLIGSETDERTGSLATALTRLETERRLYEKRGGHGLLASTEAEISGLTQRRVSLLQISETLAQREKELIAAKAAMAALSEQGANAPAAPPKQSHREKEKRPSPLLLVLSLLLMLAALILGFSLTPLLFFAEVPALFLLFLSFFYKKANHTEEDGARNEAPSPLFEERYRACVKCERAYEEAAQAAEEAAYLAVQLEGLEKKRERLSSALSDIKKTEALLTLAGQRYRESRTERTRAFFSEKLIALGEVRTEQYRLGDHFSPSFLCGAQYHDAEALSRGERDRVSLSRSLALLCAIPEDKKPPLLLDDPFLSYDDTRLGRALSTLEVLGNEYQIVYLTCSHSRMP